MARGQPDLFASRNLPGGPWPSGLKGVHMAFGWPGSARRGFLQRGALLLAGALGVGVAARQAASPSPATPMDASFDLFGRFWHVASSPRGAGQPPQRGDQFAVAGELLDAPGGAKVGEFYSACTCVAAPFGASALAAATMEVHTLSLRDGTLLGMGTATADPAAPNVYAIVGGTGRYQGVGGSYIARQRLREDGGDGTAELHVTLTGLAS